jgi:hypothetical protein
VQDLDSVPTPEERSRLRILQKRIGLSFFGFAFHFLLVSGAQLD